MRSTLASAADAPDLHLFVAGPFDDSSVPSGAIVGIVTALLSPRSRRSLRLRSADSADPPRIDPAYPGLRDAAVALSLALATALERIVQDQGLTAGDLVDVWFPNDDSGRLRRVFTPTG